MIKTGFLNNASVWIDEDIEDIRYSIWKHSYQDNALIGSWKIDPKRSPTAVLGEFLPSWIVL